MRRYLKDTFAYSSAAAYVSLSTTIHSIDRSSSIFRGLLRRLGQIQQLSIH